MITILNPIKVKSLVLEIIQILEIIKTFFLEYCYLYINSVYAKSVEHGLKTSNFKISSSFCGLER